MGVTESGRKDHRTEERTETSKESKDWDGSDKRKHPREKESGSSRKGGGSRDDEDDYDSRRESRSKIPRKGHDERGERRESSRRSRDDDDEHEGSSSRKPSVKPVPAGTREESRGKAGSKAEKASRDCDSSYSDRKEKVETRRRVDEVETRRRAEEGHHEDRKASDSRSGSVNVRSKVVDLSREKVGNSEDRRADGERSRGCLDLESQDNKAVTTPRDIKEDKRKNEKERSKDLDPHAGRKSAKSCDEADEKHPRDEVESRERSVIRDEGGRQELMRDRSGKEIRHAKRSPSPERLGRYHRELDDHTRGFQECDTKRNLGMDSNEKDKESYRDGRSSTVKADNNGGSKDYFRRSHSQQDAKDGDSYEFDNANIWDSQRHEKEKIGADKLFDRSAYRKENRVRPDGLKMPSGSGAKHSNSDSIEIKPTHNFDFGREGTASTFPGRTEAGLQQNLVSGAATEEKIGHPQKERIQDDSSTMDQGFGSSSLDSLAVRGRDQKGAVNLNQTLSSQSVNNSMHPPPNNQGLNSFKRVPQSGQKGGKLSRGRGKPPGRDSQRDRLPLPVMHSPFNHPTLPPGTLQPGGPNLIHSPGPLISSNMFISPFVWPGAGGLDPSMITVPPCQPSMPPSGPRGPLFGPNIGNGLNHALFFNQQGPGRGILPSIPDSLFNQVGSNGRDVPNGAPPSGWGQTRNNGPSGKAPSRGQQNDYSQNFVDTGLRPQNFIRELDLTSIVEDYPKLRELLQRKDDIVAKSAFRPMYYKCDLKEHVLSPEFFGTKFDAILVDPPWEEYVHRAPGVTDHLEYWTFEEIQNLKIEAIADTPSFIFMWVGDGVGLEQGRQCLKKWGFRRCEDICWIKTNKNNATPGLRHDSRTLLQHSKEHCLMGIKGTVRRGPDGHIIHANIDTDIIIAEEPTAGSTRKPDDLYRIIEHFALGKRRLELFGEDHNIRSSWLTVGKGLSSSNFNSEAYVRNFADKDGKVWQGGGGRNPPPAAPHLVLTTPEIEGLRPKSPPAKSQQL